MPERQGRGANRVNPPKRPGVAGSSSMHERETVGAVGRVASISLTRRSAETPHRSRRRASVRRELFSCAFAQDLGARFGQLHGIAHLRQMLDGFVRRNFTRRHLRSSAGEHPAQRRKHREPSAAVCANATALLRFAVAADADAQARWRCVVPRQQRRLPRCPPG